MINVYNCFIECRICDEYLILAFVVGMFGSSFFILGYVFRWIYAKFIVEMVFTIYMYGCLHSPLPGIILIAVAI